MKNELTQRIIESYKRRYHNSSKKEKGKVIAELVLRLNLSKKRVIKLLRAKNVGRLLILPHSGLRPVQYSKKEQCLYSMH